MIAVWTFLLNDIKATEHHELNDIKKSIFFLSLYVDVHFNDMVMSFMSVCRWSELSLSLLSFSPGLPRASYTWLDEGH